MVAASSPLLTNRYTHARVISPLGGAVPPALDTTQIFYLIDSYLPFEVCLHYQLLPLGVDRDRVHLGMVDPHDRSALEYAVRMAQYWNYRLIPKPISHDSLHTLLSAYLNFMQLQGPTAHQEKLRLASQVAQGQSVHKPAHLASSIAPVAAPPPPQKNMLLINDETLIFDESELIAIEASEADVLPLSGHTPPAFSPSPSLPVRGALPMVPGAPPVSTPTPASKPCQPAQATQTPRPSPTPQPSQPAKPNQPPQSQPRPNQPNPPAQPPTQQHLDQLGKTAVQLTRQLRQTMHSLQDYGTAHPDQVQRRQQAIAALGQDLHQINQDFRELWQVITAQKVS